MCADLAILLAVLKLTHSGPIDYSLISKTARIPTQTSERILAELADAALVSWKGKALEASPDQRVEIAMQAISQGADLENVCRLLQWKEFEGITTEAFETYNYRVRKNFRFKTRAGKRWEIDLIAWKRPLVASIDCKHWKHNWTRAPVTKVVDQHVQRTRDFADLLPNIHESLGLGSWGNASVIPIIMSLLPSSFKFHRKTPVVPALRLRSFLNDLPAHAHLLTHFQKKLRRLNKEMTEYQQKREQQKDGHARI